MHAVFDLPRREALQVINENAPIAVYAANGSGRGVLRGVNNIVVHDVEEGGNDVAFNFVRRVL